MLGTVTPLLKQSVTVLEEIKLGPVTQSRISTVIAMLPMSFASRISPFSSPRRSNSLHNLREKDRGDGSPGKPRPLSEADAMMLAGGRLDGQLRTDENSSVVDASELESPPLPSRILFQNTRIDGVPTRTPSGVHLNFARQGTNLVAVSVQGHQYGLDKESSVFERKTYIDGLTYLLRGLPQELEPYEAEQLRLALPKDVSVFEGASATARTTPAHERSLLHRIVQAIVVNLILVFHLVTPYLVLCLRYGAKMERKYKVSSTLMERGIDLAAPAGKRGAALTDTMWKLNDSKAGRILCDVVAWLLDGISRGVSDGIGEGLVSSSTKPTV